MTNKIVVRTVTETMSGYNPNYQPIWPLIIEGGVQHPAVEGSKVFERVEAMGDLRAKHLGSKDTDVHMINAGPLSKSFKAYFFGSQYIQSKYQGVEGNEAVVAQVLEEMNKQYDELMFLQEGTDAASAVNDGLFHSNDANYTLEASVELDNADGHLPALHAQIISNAQKANNLPGDKIIFVYGATLQLKFGGLYSSSSASFREQLEKALGAGYRLVMVPSGAGLSGNGLIFFNKSQTKTHYVQTPELEDQGVNAEKKYTWHNFGLGSLKIDVLAKDGIIRQPVTFEA